MVELKQNRKLRKLKNRYVLEIKQTYPLENVKNMLTGWKTKAESIKKFLEDFDNKIDAAMIDIDQEHSARFKKIQEDYDNFKALSKDEKIKKLLENAEEIQKEQAEMLKNKEKFIAEEKEKAKIQFKGMRAQGEEDLKKTEDAIKFWEQPV